MTKTAICALDDIPDGTAKAVVVARGGTPVGAFAVRRGDQAFVYENMCPHTGAPLNMLPDAFLNESGDSIECATHGALFQIEDGVCTAGPCMGDRLCAIAVEIKDGKIYSV